LRRISLIPDIDPPTAHIETDAALALIVFCGDLFRHSPTRCRWLSEDFCRAEHRHDSAHAFSLIVRLFGNLMSGVFIIGIILSLAGLLVLIPLMARFSSEQVDLLRCAAACRCVTWTSPRFWSRERKDTPDSEAFDDAERSFSARRKSAASVVRAAKSA
jgi:hypothetical protein